MADTQETVVIPENEGKNVENGQQPTQTQLDLTGFNSYFKTNFDENSIKSVLENHKKLSEIGDLDSLVKTKTDFETTLNERNLIFTELGIKSKDEINSIKDRLNKASYLDGIDDELLTLAAARKNGIEPALYFQVKNMDVSKMSDLEALVNDVVINLGMSKSDALEAIKEKYDFDDATGQPTSPKDKISFLSDVRNAKNSLNELKSKIVPVSLQSEIAKKQGELDKQKSERDNFIKQNREAWSDASKSIKSQVNEWLKVKDDIIDFVPETPEIENALKIVDNSLQSFLSGDIPHTKENVQAITSTLQLIAKGAAYESALKKATGKKVLETERKFHNPNAVGNNTTKPVETAQTKNETNAFLEYAKKQGIYKG